MDDLVVFLRARLAEEQLLDWHARDCQTHRLMPPGSPLGLGGSPMSCNCDVPTRMLAEYETKSRIVGYIAEELEDRGASNPWWYPERIEPVLRLLALLHAGHPDYRESWWPS